MVIDLPLPPNLAQLGGGWRARHYKKKTWGRLAVARFVEQGLRFPAEPWPRVRVQCHFRTWNRMDDDNLGHRQKLILDFLKTDRRGSLGFFEDDSPKFVELLPATQEIDRLRRGVTVTLEAIE